MRFFGHYSYRRKLLSMLEELVYMAEKGTPMDETFPEFPNDDRFGRLLNRLTVVLTRSARDKDSLIAAKERVAMESQDNIRQKKQLTQNINHELKTPVSSINGYLETLITNRNLSEAQKEMFIRKCYEQSQRLSNLLLDLSAITRMDEAGSMIEKEQLSLSELVSEVVMDIMPVQPSSDKPGIRIIDNLPAGLQLYGNRELLYSIFHNLIENAIFYSKGTKVVIGLSGEDADSYELSVADDGVGIAKIHLERIFERFYRIDKGRSRKLGGTGLGLSIVKNAVNLHGGTIIARQADPTGLEFVFTLSKKDSRSEENGIRK